MVVVAVKGRQGVSAHGAFPPVVKFIDGGFTNTGSGKNVMTNKLIIQLKLNIVGYYHGGAMR